MPSATAHGPRALLGATLLAVLAGCHAVAIESPGTHASPTHDVAREPAPAFVQGACGGCHAVEPPDISPNPMSPSFAAIANSEGLDRQTLTTWLRDAHNYPEQMEFDLDPPEVELLVDYILTLRDPNWRQPPS